MRWTKGEMVGTALWAEILVVTSYTKLKNMYSSRSNNCLFCCGKHDPQYHKPITFEEEMKVDLMLGKISEFDMGYCCHKK